MRAVVNIDGQIVDGQDARVSVFDHGFLFGEGVYETLRTYNRRVLLLDRHLRRLRLSAGMLELPVPLDDAAFAARLDATMAALPPADARELYVRVLLTRGVGDLSYDPAVCPRPTLVMIVRPLVEPPAAIFADGVAVALVGVIRNHPGSVNPLIKSNNLLNNVLAMQEALRQGAYEALMRNHRGEIAECSQSNFFIVRDGCVLTPSLDAGLLAGVTREVLFEIGARAGLAVGEAVLHDEDVFGADEAFLTSTTREVLPVVQVGGRRIGQGTPGPVTRRLLAAYREMVAESCGARR